MVKFIYPTLRTNPDKTAPSPPKTGGENGLNILASALPQMYTRGCNGRVNWNLHSDTLTTPPLIFYGVKKCDIWHTFSTASFKDGVERYFFLLEFERRLLKMNSGIINNGW